MSNQGQYCGLEDADFSEVIGKEILGTRIYNNEEVLLILEGGYSVYLRDDGQSCCETRYITCDDNLSDLIGSKFTHIKELKHTTTDESDEYENEHEITFIEIRAGDTLCTVCTHNEHNGYYGGFNLNIEITKKE